MYGYCVVSIGIDPLYFLDEMSPDELMAIYKAYSLVQKQKIDEHRTSWEQVRTLSFYSVTAIQGTEKFKSPSDLFELPWDKEPKVAVVSKSKMMTRDEFLNVANNLINGK
jgi:hypothetical protein